MGAALFITLERKIAGFDPSAVSGKSLSKNLELLDRTCQALNVRLLSEFISMDPTEAAEFLEGEGVDFENVAIPPERWFDAHEGLVTIQALLAEFESANSADRALIADLSACHRILTRAKHGDVRFHFTVDF